MRKVILHYHFFKNAGTSVDAAFKENLAPEEWVTAEFPGQPKANREQVAQWILDNPQAKVFSSHTAFLPPPKLKGIQVLPVIFLRHPIDRIASAYSFEAQQSGNSFGAVLARNTDLRGYIETRLALPNDRQCRNFHVYRLAMMHGHQLGNEYTRAKKALEALPVVGIVENYASSIQQIQAWLRSEGFGQIHLNVLEKNTKRDPNSSLQTRLNSIKACLGESFYQKLMAQNKEDITLYNEAIKKQMRDQRSEEHCLQQ